MTEQEWLECKDPPTMLKFLEDKASGRKFRLFACACCRSIWIYLVDDRSKKAVIAAEQYADDMLRWDQLEASLSQWTDYYHTESRTYQILCEAVRYVCSQALNLYCITHYTAAAVAFYTKQNSADKQAVKGEQIVQARILREIFGNPFRPAIIEPSWLAWNNGTVVKIAEAIYTDRAFDHLPILADAPQDSGCDNADILNHCRQASVHVRGCWVVDLLLGKE